MRLLSILISKVLIFPWLGAFLFFSCSSKPNTDTTAAPTLSVSVPSASLVNATSAAVTFVVTYSGATTINLLPASVILNKTGTATCATKTVANGTTSTPTVSLSGCTGAGTVGITISAGTAYAQLPGNTTTSSSASGTFTIDNTGIGSAIYSPVTGTYVMIPTSVTITFPETITGSSVTAADFAVTGTCNTLPVLAVASTVGATATISLTGALCTVGQTTIVTTNFVGILDAAGNAGAGSNTLTYTLDDVGPNSATFSSVTSSVSMIPSSVAVTYNESVLASSVTSIDFAITGTCTTLPTVSVTSVSGAVANLSLAGAACTLNQTVILTADLSGVSDLTSNLGTGSFSATYTFDNVGPALQSFTPASASFTTLPTSVSFTFGENLLSSSVIAGDLVVTGTCSTLPTSSVTSVAGATVTFGISGAICSLAQTVDVALNGSDVTDAAGNLGTGASTATYTFDNVGPVATSTSPTTGTVNAIPASITFSFDEALFASSVATTDMTISGTCTTLPTGALTSVAGAAATFSLSGASCTHGQSVTATVNGASVTDTAGNAGSGTALSNFTIDTVGPTPSAIAPVSGNRNTMPASITVAFDEAILSASVAPSDLGISGTCSTLPTSSVTSVIGSTVTFGVSAATCSEGQTLIITSLGSNFSDLAGNAGSNNQVTTYTKDSIGPAVVSFSPATSAVLSTPTSVTVNFSEAVLVSSVTAADFAVSGTCGTLPTLSVTSVSGSTAVVALSGAVCAHGQTTTITVALPGITDLAGNAGVGNSAVTYTVDNVGPTTLSFSPASGAPPGSVDITFSENLAAGSVQATDFVVGGTCTTLPTLTVTSVVGAVVTVGLSPAMCVSTQTVTITINAALVADTLGNAGSGTSVVTFTQ